jgi:hypothetical protein
MRKPYMAMITAAGFLVAVGASAAVAGGGRSATGGPSGKPFQPPGWSHAPWNSTNSGLNNTFTTQPPGWSNNSTGQTKADWFQNLSGSGGIPHGLNTH